MASTSECQGCLGFAWTDRLLPQVHSPLRPRLVSLIPYVQIGSQVKLGGWWGEPRMGDSGTVWYTQCGVEEETLPTLTDNTWMAPLRPLTEDGGEYILHSDGSKYAVRAVLSQMQQDRETRVIAFGAGSLTVQRHDTRHTIKNFYHFGTHSWTSTTTAIHSDISLAIQRTPFYCTCWHDLNSWHPTRST